MKIPDKAINPYTASIEELAWSGMITDEELELLTPRSFSEHS